jgi:hypothetical protein
MSAKAARSITKGVYPVSADVEAHIRRLKRRHPAFVRTRKVLDSVEGRPIYAVTVTDPRAPDAQKQNVLIVGGQHGNEESGRIVALAILDWLTTASAAETRRRQKIVVMPNVNPDGAESDAHGNANGVQPNLDHAPSGAKTPEGKAVESVAYELQPEVYVDLHACGGTGCGADITLYPPPKNYTEDDYFLHRIADEMMRAGERAGIPQYTHPLEWWGQMDFNCSSSTMFCYRNFKSLVLLTENTESNEFSYSVADRARAGLAKVKALLAWGNRHHPKLRYPGYPCMFAGGLFNRGIVAVGKTAAARRRSRIGIWKNVALFKELGIDAPQKPFEKTMRIDYAGARLRAGVGFQTCARGKLAVRKVLWNGQRLRPSETNGYYSLWDGCATYIVIARPDFKPGRYVAEISFGR